MRPRKVGIWAFGMGGNMITFDSPSAATRCAVLHSVAAGNDPVAESGCGLTVIPQSPEAVADGLRRLAAIPEAERRAMGERGRQFVLSRHTYPVLAQRFLQALQR